MKLGEALFRIAQIEERLDELQVLFQHGPREGVPVLLEEFNNLIGEQFLLEDRVLLTSQTTPFEQNTVFQARRILKTLTDKVNTLDLVRRRPDLEPENVSSISKQMEEFNSTRMLLDRRLTNCLWETELVDNTE